MRERGNWPLIRRCKKQFQDFVLCRTSLNNKPLWAVIPYWYSILKGPEVLIWRLETFGFLFPQGISQETKQNLNKYISE